MSAQTIVNIADLKDPDDPQGRSYREVNQEKRHAIPIGALVEVIPSPEEGRTQDGYKNGVRLFVVHHARDCDQTPLYCLGPDPDDTAIQRQGFYNPQWDNGYGEESLRVIELPPPTT
jgi:hypothetical protein